MNKKFSTLMAGLMLASAFSVASAENPSTKYEDGKYYLLHAEGKGYLSVISTPGDTYGQLTCGQLDNDGTSGVSLTETREALWQVTVKAEKLGDTPTYQFVNVATGQILSLPVPNAVGASQVVDKLAGSNMEWYNGASSTVISDYNPFFSYVDENEVIAIATDAQIGSSSRYSVKVVRQEVQTVINDASAGASSNYYIVQPYLADVVALGANELNKEFIMNNDDDDDASFTLSFNRDVTEGAATNLFAATALQAEDVASTGYVRLHVKDDKSKYLVVDTALHAGSEASRQLPKFTYEDRTKDAVDGNNVKRLEGSYEFKFAYDPTSNRVLIKAHEYYTRAYAADGSWAVGTVNGTRTGDGNTAYTGWGPSSSLPAGATAGATVTDAYIRLVELSNVRELTVASAPVSESKPWYSVYNISSPYTVELGADNLVNGMLTTVTLGKGLMNYEPTTIESGLYMIQFKGTNDGIKATDNYFIANLGGAFGFAEQARNQNFDHMPAAQWYVEKQGTIATAPITIRNREFWDVTKYNNSTTDNIGKDVTMQAFKGENGEVFFTSGAFEGDTLKFIPVSDASKADSLLGYKHVDEKQASVETYYLNYLHGLALDKGLNTPIATDSLVRVDENGDKIAFRLIPVIEHDSYGIQLDEKKSGVANLIRNAYYIEAYDNLKFVEDGESRYLRFDDASKKYVMSKTPKAYFLKENNCIDDTHYYALVEANVLYRSLQGLLTEISLGASEANLPYYAPEFAGKSVKEAGVKTYGKIWYETDATKRADYLNNTIFFPLDKNGQPVITDDSNVALYAYQNVNDVVTLKRISKKNGSTTNYAYLNGEGANDIKFQDKNERNQDVDYTSQSYASARVSVDDNTLDLTQAELEDKWNKEIRVSAFEVAVNNAPLYRRFNGVAPETYGDATNAPLNLKFFRHNNNAEYLFENYSSENKYRDGINDKSISFLGVNNAYQFAENETRSYTMYVDTAYVRNNTRMPQYLIAVKPEIVEGDTILCDASTHQHATPEEALACEHTQIKVGFTRAMYLFNAQDSVDVKNYDYQGKAAYGAKDYTRLAFKDAVHAQDTLYILNPGVTTEQLKATNLKDGSLFAKKINLDNNKHKNVVFQFRLIDEDNNRFLIESEAEQNGAAVLNKDLQNVCVAPMRGGWVKVQNGVPVIARFQDFNEAIAQAEIFDVNDDIKYDAVDNDEIAVEGVSVVAGDGQVTIMGAAGKNVTITNILGKVIASQVIASDNATIAVPAGIVAVAVEGEAAVKAIVK